MNGRMIINILGHVVKIEGLLMLPSFLIGLIYGESQGWVFLTMAAVCLLMGTTYAAMQISPTHVCLVVAADYFHVSMGELIRKTIPASLVFCALMILYYMLIAAL